MLYVKLLGVYCKNHIKYTKRTVWANLKVSIVKPDGVYEGVLISP